MNYVSIDSAPPAAGQSQAIGTLSGKKVYSVIYPGGLTGILVERQTNRYLPALFVSPERPIDSLGIVKMEGEDVLVYSSTIPGTGNFRNEWYFVSNHGIPKRVDYESVLSDELKKILPEHYGVWKGGGFDASTLTFSHSVWKDGDANCCPSGGSVKVLLGLKDGRFVVKSSHWEKP
jgi:hypothetical protein